MVSRYHELVGAKLLGCHKKTDARAIYWRRQGPIRELIGITIIYVVAGIIKLVFKDRVLFGNKGELLFFDHGKLMERYAVPGEALTYYFATFLPIGASGQLDFTETGLSEVNSVKDKKEFIRWFEELGQYYLTKDPGWSQECSIRLLHILASAAPEIDREQVPESGPDDRLAEKRIGDVMNYINDNYKKRLSIKELAEVAKMHPVHLNRLFHKVVGVSPHRYVLEKKIIKAKDFIMHFNESLTTTAIELGFHDYSHFARAFNKVTSISPKKFFESTRGQKKLI